MVKRVFKKPMGPDSDNDLKDMFREEFGIDMDEAVPGKDGKFVAKEEKKKSSKEKKTIKEHTEFSEENEEKVSKKDTDKKISDLEEKIRKLEIKNKDLADERNKYKKSSESFEKLYNGKNTDCAKLESKVEKLSKDKSDLEDNLKILKKEKKPVVVEDGDKINKLKKDLSDAKSDNKTLSSKLKDLETEIVGKEKTIAELNRKIEELEKSVPKEEPADGTVKRISPSEYKSSLFREGPYAVNLSTDLSKLTFKFDILGKARCEKKIITLPAMAKYHSFVREVEYPATVTEDGTIEIRLNRCSRDPRVPFRLRSPSLSP